ncbi:hypothetical protein [Streptomyces chartreusis]|uniref:hypothetical protein n=1 Tax=Streptomyces chartreusis TaxID=1969 RepID=UPI0038675D7B|nr:hypothetical protein OG938_35620 [Streptomyces chartreusis]
MRRDSQDEATDVDRFSQATDNTPGARFSPAATNPPRGAGTAGPATTAPQTHDTPPAALPAER